MANKIPIVRFTPEQMRQFGALAVETTKERWSRGVDVNDDPAKPLSRAYAKQKLKLGQPDIRNVYFSGETQANLQVLTAAPTSVDYGFTSDHAARAISGIDRIDQMSGLSPSDQATIDAEVRSVFARNLDILNRSK